jgi:hypothetical protein
MRQQLWGYEVEEKTYLGIGERKKLNIAATEGFDVKAVSLNITYLGTVWSPVNASLVTNHWIGEIVCM